MHTTTGTLLNGRVRYTQPVDGFRTGIEPVLLAASVPARSGARVLEGGTGAGAALLCLAARVPEIVGVGFDRDVDLVRMAQANAAANLAPGLLFVAADVVSMPFGGPFDHVLANPPYHEAGGTPSPHSNRRRAMHAICGAIENWAAALGSMLRHDGSLTMILSPGKLTEALAGAARSGCGSPRIFPLWPRAGQTPKLLLLQALRGGRAPLTLLPGMILHASDGRFTEAADASLRHGIAVKI